MPFRNKINQRFTVVDKSVNDFLLKELLSAHRLHGQLRGMIWEMEAENDRLRDLLKESQKINQADQDYIRSFEAGGFFQKLKFLFR